MQKPHIGMRKIKSILAVGISFVIWQILRLFLPMLEVHPIFAYVYAIIELRETADKTKDYGKLRIKSTLIGLFIGLIFVSISSAITPLMTNQWSLALIELLIILLMVLCTLCTAEMFDCKTFCGIAAIIAVICLVSHSGEDRYLYAITRVIQTLIGVFSALVVNRKKNKNTPNT